MFFFANKCPHCKQKGHKVENDTMIPHVKDISRMGDGGYSYCQNSNCDVVYFRGEEVFTTTMVNKEIGFKHSASDSAAVCFCYNYPKSELYNDALIDKINIRIENYGNRCDIRSPSGRCCIKAIEAMQKEKKEEELHDIFEGDH
jgi:hypothetical protein